MATLGLSVAMLGWPEIIGVLVVVLVLFGARKLPELARGLEEGFSEFRRACRRINDVFDSTLDITMPSVQKPVADALTTTNQTAEDTSQPAPATNTSADHFALWVAQGFGAGLVPFAPGTVGSVVGLGWVAVLLLPGSLGFFFFGIVLSVIASVWFCGRVETILRQRDPGSVVLDEIVALPVCFAGLVILHVVRNGTMPDPVSFLIQDWPGTLDVFLLFRFFDVIKPWPVRQSQSLPGGWGVVVDDLLAAAYVNIVALVLYFLAS